MPTLPNLQPTPLTQTQLIQAEINNLANLQNNEIQRQATELMNQWRNFWAADRDIGYFQQLLDTMAGVTYTVNGVQTNALAAYFTNAATLYTTLVTECPTIFASALQEGVKAVDPLGAIYTQYKTSGWYWTASGTNASGMLLTGPITNWK